MRCVRESLQEHSLLPALVKVDIPSVPPAACESGLAQAAQKPPGCLRRILGRASAHTDHQLPSSTASRKTAAASRGSALSDMTFRPRYVELKAKRKRREGGRELAAGGFRVRTEVYVKVRLRRGENLLWSGRQPFPTNVESLGEIGPTLMQRQQRVLHERS